MYNISDAKNAQTACHEDGVAIHIDELNCDILFISHKSPEMEQAISAAKDSALLLYNESRKGRDAILDAEHLPSKYKYMWMEKVSIQSMAGGKSGVMMSRSEDGEEIEIKIEGMDANGIRACFNSFSPLPHSLVDDLFMAGRMVDGLEYSAILEKKRNDTAFSLRYLRGEVDVKLQNLERLISGLGMLTSSGQGESGQGESIQEKT